MKTIGILEAGRTPSELISKHGTYAEMLQRLINGAQQQVNPNEPLQYQVFSVLYDEFPDSIKACDGWILSGSRHGVYENLPWMLRLQDFIHDIEQQKMPLIGVCFGHQLIAQTLGGHVEKSSKGWGVGLQEYQLETLAELGTQQHSLNLLAMHQDQVVKCPPQAKVVASSDFCQYAALLYDNHIFTIQAHPEFSFEFEQEMLNLRRGTTIPEQSAVAATASMQTSKKTDSGIVANWMYNILTQRIK